MYVVKDDDERTLLLPAKELHLSKGVELRILNLLSKKPSYPKDIAKRLNLHEQKIYYHFRQLEKKGFVKVVGKEEKGAAFAKIYALEKPAFFMRFAEYEAAERIPKGNSFLEPFITNGTMNAKIVIGSSDPHGPERARSRDAAYAVELGMFLGTFLVKKDSMNVHHDVDLHEHELKDNLIIIGGPVTNRVARMLNAKMPVNFDRKKNVYSSLSERTYYLDETGIIVKMPNPFDEAKTVLWLAGKRYMGTRAAVIAAVRHMNELERGNAKNPKIFAKVVEGLDEDGDGAADAVQFME
ncbi:MAG: helix-turn-helix domain-containing protein [Candidatus Aenigmarchaeota archaeon]|nr:helix-turn-helix domain-containing protein [Candidatus Aenigmarchaeota archaeon]